MSKDREAVMKYVCPACFAKEIDVFMNYDFRDEEYYCTKCCYVGKEADVKRFYNMYKREKFKDADK